MKLGIANTQLPKQLGWLGKADVERGHLPLSMAENGVTIGVTKVGRVQGDQIEAATVKVGLPVPGS